MGRSSMMGFLATLLVVTSSSFSSPEPPQEPSSPTTTTDPQQSSSQTGAKSEAEPSSTVAGSNTAEAEIAELLSIVTDNTLKLSKKDMPAYWLVLEKVRQKDFQSLLTESQESIRFNDLYSSPSRFRGKPLKLELNARRVVSYPINHAELPGVTRLYEIWGWTNEAKAWMYCVLTSELPEGLPKEGDFRERIEVAGYFFRMQAYQPGASTANGRPLVAPLVIGKVRRNPLTLQEVDGRELTWSPSLMILPFALTIACWWIVRFQLNRVRRTQAATRGGSSRFSRRRSANDESSLPERVRADGANDEVDSDEIRGSDSITWR